MVLCLFIKHYAACVKSLSRYGLIRGIVDVNIWGVLPGNKGNQVTQKIFYAVYGWIKLGKIHHENTIKLLEKNKVT